MPLRVSQWTRMLSHFSRVQLFASLCTVACQAPLSMEYPRQEYWSRLPFPPPGNCPDPGFEPISLSPVLTGGVFFFYHSLEFKSILGSFRIRASADYRAIALELVRGDVDLVIGNILKLSQKDVLKFLCFLKGEKHLKKA